MLHILPSTVKKEDEGEVGADSGYKKQKALKDKANSSRYWSLRSDGEGSFPYCYPVSL